MIDELPRKVFFFFTKERKSHTKLSILRKSEEINIDITLFGSEKRKVDSVHFQSINIFFFL